MLQGTTVGLVVLSINLLSTSIVGMPPAHVWLPFPRQGGEQSRTGWERWRTCRSSAKHCRLAVKRVRHALAEPRAGLRLLHAHKHAPTG